MVFVTETIDYGTVAHNSDGKRNLFSHNGNKPLIIINAQGSCGLRFLQRANCSRCKRSYWVKYDTSRGGQPFSKTVTLTTNAVFLLKHLQ
jgi:hypothetical protein